MRRIIGIVIIIGIIGFIIFFISSIIMVRCSADMTYTENNKISLYPENCFNIDSISEVACNKQYINDDRDKISYYSFDSTKIIIWEINNDVINTIDDIHILPYKPMERNAGAYYANIPIIDTPFSGALSRCYAKKSDICISFDALSKTDLTIQKNGASFFIQDSISVIYINYSENSLDNGLFAHQGYFDQLYIIVGQQNIFIIVRINPCTMLKSNNIDLRSIIHFDNFRAYKEIYKSI